MRASIDLASRGNQREDVGGESGFASTTEEAANLASTSPSSESKGVVIAVVEVVKRVWAML
jgi:hypothetical protein